MQGRIKVINKKGTGLLLEGNESWFNAGKNAKVAEQMKALSRGDEVEYEAKEGGWLQSISKTGNAQSSQPTSPSGTQGIPTRIENNSQDVQGRIARSVAVQAVMASPLLAQAYKDADSSEAISEAKKLIGELTEYVNSGKFHSEQENA